MALRTGDVYALMIEFHHSQQTRESFQSAFGMLERMRASGVPVAPYVDASILQDICSVLGVSPDHFAERRNQQGYSAFAMGNATGAAQEAQDDEEVMEEQIGGDD